ncbi:MAG: RIP metalloprotease RseP [Gemmatimonadales bacterium]|nr:MAG: RIP metalloprotease RseP [Gemmatimonadales bacterium]
MVTIIATIIVLGVLIFVHELGHFWAAKSVGVRVERFSIGLGPRVAGFTRGDTEYILAAIPLGGYVKMAGMGDEMMEKIEGGPSESSRSHGGEGEVGATPTEGIPMVDPPPASGARDPEATDTGSFDARPVWARAWVISAGVIMNMLFAFAAYTAIAAGWGEAVPDTLAIGQVSEELLPEGTEALAGIPPGATIVSIGDRTPEHWGDVHNAMVELPAGPVTVRHENPSGSVEIVLPEVGAPRDEIRRALRYWIEPVVAGLEPGAPADRGGLEAGDRITAVDDVSVEVWSDFQRLIQARPGQETQITLLRGDTELVRTLTPTELRGENLDTGEEMVIGRVGIFPQNPPVVYEALAPGEALVTGYRETVAVTGLIMGFLRDLVTGQMSPRNLGSIVTIGEASGQAAAQGIPVFLGFMAFFSINLAILNLLPIPILDGGHLVFLGLEAIRGRPVSMQTRLRWSQIGMVVLLGIMALALGNDFLRLFGM